MNERIINTTNQYVGKDDILVYNGDFVLAKGLDRHDQVGYVNLVKTILDKLTCKNIIFITGNHDRTWVKRSGDMRPNWLLWDLFRVWECDQCQTVYDSQQRFGYPKECNCEKSESAHPIYNIHPMGYELRLTPKLCSEHEIAEEHWDKLIVCTHYSLRVWNKSHHHRSINLYGHSHGGLPGIYNSIDVAFNVWNRPLPLDEILDKIIPEHNKTESGKVYYGHHQK